MKIGNYMVDTDGAFNTYFHLCYSDQGCIVSANTHFGITWVNLHIEHYDFKKVF